MIVTIVVGVVCLAVGIGIGSYWGKPKKTAEGLIHKGEEYIKRYT